MKKNRFIYFVLLFAGALSLFAACSKKDDLNIPLIDLGGDVWARTKTDQWLQDSVLKIYNIEVTYKSDISQNSSDPDKLLAPPYDSLVIPYMQSVSKIWLDVYDSATSGTLFMKRFAPKSLLLIGSPNPSAAGTAEGDAKIILFDVNSFGPFYPLNGIAHLLHHEFTHILNGSRGIPPAYQAITAADYAGAGWQVTTEDPYSLGFVSKYARKDVGEDFAEMVSTMLVDSAGYYYNLNRSVNISNGGSAKLKKKEAIVVDFFASSFGIDFYKLQAITQAALR